jgi:hypothetical protein
MEETFFGQQVKRVIDEHWLGSICVFIKALSVLRRVHATHCQATLREELSRVDRVEVEDLPQHALDKHNQQLGQKECKGQ